MDSTSDDVRDKLPQQTAVSPMFPWWIALVVTVTSLPLAWWIQATRPLFVGDEAWFLQVATRVASGEILYRDVYAPVTPLSVWLTAAAVSMFGSDIWVLRGLVLGAWGLTLLLSLFVIRRLKLPWLATIPVTVAMLTLNAPGACGPGSAYNPFSQAFMVGAMLGALVWLDAEDSRQRIFVVITAGLFGGLALATKQNLGVLAIAAFLGTTALISMARRQWKDALLTVGICLGTAAVVLGLFAGAVKYQSAAEEMLRYGFAGQTTYIEEAEVPYLDGVISLFTNFAPPTSLTKIAQSVLLIVFLLPYFAIGLPMIAWARSRDPHAYVLLVWGATGLMAAYPRWDTPHLDIGAPLLVLAIAGALGMLTTSARGRRAVWISVTVFAFVCLATIVGFKASQIADGSLRKVSMPHFSGVYVRYDDDPLRDQRRIVTSVRLLQRLGKDKKIVILGYHSGLLYLASEIENPTPYDYAAGGIVGPREGWEILKLYQAGEVDAVWVDQSNRIPGFPVSPFARWLEQKWTPTLHSAYGTLYEPSAAWKARLEQQ